MREDLRSLAILVSSDAGTITKFLTLRLQLCRSAPLKAGYHIPKRYVKQLNIDIAVLILYFYSQRTFHAVCQHLVRIYTMNPWSTVD